MTNIKSGKIENFEDYRQFDTLKDFNNHMEMWMIEHKGEFSKSELVGLKRLVRFSAKIPGVCNAKIGTILKAIHEEYQELGISRSTFKRMIVKAKSLGILSVYETERKNGSQSSNLYVFNRFPSHEPPEPQQMNHHNKSINLLKTNLPLTTKREEETPSNTELDHTFTNDRVPQDFVQLVKYFFPEAKMIQEYWRMARIAAYRNNRENEHDQVLEISTLSFKQMISRMKLNRSVKNPVAYYYGIMNSKFEKLYFEELFEMEFE